MKIKEHDLDRLDEKPKEKMRKKSKIIKKSSDNDKRNKPKRGKRDKLLCITF